MKRTGAHVRSVASAIILFAAGVVPGAAQTFEYVYGSNTCREDGKHGVAPVVNCAGGGYIAVGSSELGGGTACGNYDVYVVHTNNAGASVWEFTYDLANVGGQDFGRSIVELSDGTGYIVTGTTDLATGNYDVFLLKIDCNGKFVWLSTYGGTGNETGADVIEAASFTTTNPYDLVVAGQTNTTTPGNEDGYILRTDATGLLLWDASYHQGEHEWFLGLTEATPTATGGGGLQVVGDIIAVGARKAPVPIVPTAIYQGYVVRVDGTNGAITPVAPLLQNAADFGGPLATDEWFNSVVELQSAAEFPNVAIAGFSTNQGNEVYLVKTTGDPCVQLADQLIGDGAGGVDWEGAHDIVEVRNPMPIAAAGDLAITGFTTNAGINGATDAFLLTMPPGGATPLAPNVGSGRLYGDFGALPDDGFSLHEVTAAGAVTAGFVIAGTRWSDPIGVGDPADMYLIKTRNNGNTGRPITPCNRNWAPGNVAPAWVPNCLTPTIGSIKLQANWTMVEKTQNWPDQVCFSLVKMSPEGSDDGNPPLPGMTIRSFPNPVRSGGTITMSYAPESDQPVTVTVVNALGEVVRTMLTPNAGGEVTIEFNTAGLAAGTYLMQLDDGATTENVRFVVTE